jgi:membrane protein
MNLFGRCLWSAFRRVIPGCIAQSQAIAFNMFLSFFPMMLLILGLEASSARLRGSLLGIIVHLRVVLPPGAARVFSDFLAQRHTSPWSLISLGLGGTLVAGTQMMRLTIDGFQMVYRSGRKARFWIHNLRAMLLLLFTIAPWLATAYLIIFGRQLRTAIIRGLAVSALVNEVSLILYVIITLIMAMIVLSVIYRLGWPYVGKWTAVLPGSAVATLLWWLVSIGLGFYIRHLPYSAIYGGVAVEIGLMLWMQLTALIILFGAAFNAAVASSR